MNNKKKNLIYMTRFKQDIFRVDRRWNDVPSENSFFFFCYLRDHFFCVHFHSSYIYKAFEIWVSRQFIHTHTNIPTYYMVNVKEKKKIK